MAELDIGEDGTVVYRSGASLYRLPASATGQPRLTSSATEIDVRLLSDRAQVADDGSVFLLTPHSHFSECFKKWIQRGCQHFLNSIGIHLFRWPSAGSAGWTGPRRGRWPQVGRRWRRYLVVCSSPRRSPRPAPAALAGRRCCQSADILSEVPIETYYYRGRSRGLGGWGGRTTVPAMTRQHCPDGRQSEGAARTRHRERRQRSSVGRGAKLYFLSCDCFLAAPSWFSAP